MILPIDELGFNSLTWACAQMSNVELIENSICPNLFYNQFGALDQYNPCFQPEHFPRPVDFGNAVIRTYYDGEVSYYGIQLKGSREFCSEEFNVAVIANLLYLEYGDLIYIPRKIAAHDGIF